MLESNLNKDQWILELSNVGTFCGTFQVIYAF